jgi:hypothetical protein
MNFGLQGDAARLSKKPRQWWHCVFFDLETKGARKQSPSGRRVAMPLEQRQRHRVDVEMW